MSLIIVKQAATGTYAYQPETFESEINDIWAFKTTSKTIAYSTTVGGNNFEYKTGQLIWKDPNTNTEYYYTNAGGPASFYTVAAPSEPEKRYNLNLLKEPFQGGTGQITTGTNSNLAGDPITIVATPNAGYIFKGWINLLQVITTNEVYSFNMPPANTIYVAKFELEFPPEEPEILLFEPVKIPLQDYNLELRVNGTQIPIVSITQKIVSNLFSDELEGDYSLPINIKLTDEIKTALGLPNDPQSRRDFTKKIQASLYGNGNRIYQGYILILGADENSIRTSFVFLSGFFIDDNKEKKVADCYKEDDIIILDEPKTAVGGYEIRFYFRDMFLKINGQSKSFYAVSFEEHIDMVEAMAAWLKSLPLNLQVTIQYSDDLTDESSRIYVWETNITTTLELIVLNPYTNSSRGSRYSRARRLTSIRYDMERFATPDPENRIAFPQFFNRNLYDSTNLIHDGIVNRYDSLGRMHISNTKYFTYSEAFRWEHTIIPLIYLTDIVKKIFEFLHIQVSGEFFENDMIKKILVYNNRTLDFLSIKTISTEVRRTADAVNEGDKDPSQTTYAYENTHDLNIKLKNHVPNVNIPDFLKAIKNLFNLKYDFNILQSKVEIRFVKDIYNNTQRLDLSKYCSKVYTLDYEKEDSIAYKYLNPDPIMEDGSKADSTLPKYTVPNFLALLSLDAAVDEVAYVRSLKASFRLTPNNEEEPTWKVYQFDQRDETGEKKKSWELGMYGMVDGYIDDRKMPCIEHTANQPEINLFNTETGLRITGFYGMQEDGAGQPYAFASASKYNARELVDYDQYDLYIRSKDMQPYWKDTNNTLSKGRIFATNMIIDNRIQKALSRTSRITIANVDYIIEELEITNNYHEFATVRAKMRKA